MTEEVQLIRLIETVSVWGWMGGGGGESGREGGGGLAEKCLSTPPDTCLPV